MLVLDPAQRYTIDQIKHHRWILTKEMIHNGIDYKINKKSIVPNEQILRLMSGLGIEAQKTRDSLKVLICFYFKLDGMKVCI